MSPLTKNQQFAKRMFIVSSVLYVISFCLLILAIVTHQSSDAWGIALVVTVASGIGSIFTWTIWHKAPALTKRGRPYGWIMTLILAILFLNNARLDWFNHANDLDGSAWTYWFGFVILVILIARLVTDSWTKMFWYDRELKPKDEREEHVLHRSTQTTFYAAMIMIVLLADLFLVAPVPSKSALFDLMIGVGALLLGLRNFFSWKYGY